MKRTYLILAFLVTSIVILSVIQISLSNILTTGGIQIETMQQQLVLLQKDNASLKEQMYSLASLTHIAEVASKEGFIADQKTAFVTNNSTTPLAIKP